MKGTDHNDRRYATAFILFSVYKYSIVRKSLIQMFVMNSCCQLRNTKHAALLQSQTLIVWISFTRTRKRE